MGGRQAAANWVLPATGLLCLFSCYLSKVIPLLTCAGRYSLLSCTLSVDADLQSLSWCVGHEMTSADQAYLLLCCQATGLLPSLDALTSTAITTRMLWLRQTAVLLQAHPLACHTCGGTEADGS